MDGIDDFNSDLCVSMAWRWRTPFGSLDLADTAIIGVDNRLKCVQHELQKIVYIFVHVCDVEQNSDVKATDVEERVIEEGQSLQRLDNRDLEVVLQSRRRIIQVSMPEIGDSGPLLNLWLAFDDDVEALSLLRISIGAIGNDWGQDRNGISHKLLIVVFACACHDPVDMDIMA